MVLQQYSTFIKHFHIHVTEIHISSPGHSFHNLSSIVWKSNSASEAHIQPVIKSMVWIIRIAFFASKSIRRSFKRWNYSL